MALSVVSESVEKVRALLLKPTVKTVLGNFLSLSSIQVLGQIATLVILPYITRALGIEKFGVTSFAINFVAFFQFAIAYGFNNTAARTASIHRDDHEMLRSLFGAVTSAKITLSLLFSFIYFAIIFFVPYYQFHTYKAVYIILYLTVIGETLFPMWIFMGLEKMKFLGIMNFVSKMLILIATLLYVNSPDDYILYGGLSTITHLLNGFAGMYIVLFHFKIIPTLPTPQQIFTQLKEGFPVFISFVSIYIYTSCRVMIFGLFAHEDLIGKYAIGERISNAIQIFPVSSLLMAAIPRLTNIFHNDKEKAVRTIRNLQKTVSVYVLILLPLVVFFADDLVLLVSGNTYFESILSLRILIISTAAVLLNTFRVNYFIIAGDYTTFSRLHVISSIVGLLLILTLTWSFSYQGMAWAIVGLEVSILIATMFIQRRQGVRI